MDFDFSAKRVAVLGAGKMGGILLKVLLDKKLLSAPLTRATVQHEDRACALADKLGINVGTDNRDAVQDADIILISVKPQAVKEVLHQIAPAVS
ncbi:MAG: NAD(P)-binding domain-containing protein, partial [Acidobacteriales bacterium]|nr:NAD(P)-binding domain-containing protein [Terriglobales bacterium]